MAAVSLIDTAYDAEWAYGLCSNARWVYTDTLLTIETTDHVLLVWDDGWRHMEYNEYGAEVRQVSGFTADGLLDEMRRI